MFRFTIRDVLWLTTLVAVLAAWWLEHRLMKISHEKLRTGTERAERLAEEAKAMAAQAKVWSDVSRAREREVRKYVEQLHEQIGPLVSRIELDKAGRPVVTPLPSRDQPATPNDP